MQLILLKRALLTSVTILFTIGYVQAHSGPLNEIALKACDTKSRSQSCQYNGGHQDLYIGTCQYMAEALMCVRNQPIQKIELVNGKTDVEAHTHN